MGSFTLVAVCNLLINWDMLRMRSFYEVVYPGSSMGPVELHRKWNSSQENKKKSAKLHMGCQLNSNKMASVRKHLWDFLCIMGSISASFLWIAK